MELPHFPSLSPVLIKYKSLRMGAVNREQHNVSLQHIPVSTDVVICYKKALKPRGLTDEKL